MNASRKLLLSAMLSLGLLGNASAVYVDGNPVSYADPSGLVKWQGNVVTVGVTAPFGAGFAEATLYSECVNGKRLKVEVMGAGPAAGAGVKVAATVSSISFDDHNDVLDASGFDGAFTTVSANATFGAIPKPPPNVSTMGLGKPGAGTGVGYIQFGKNFSDPLPPGMVVGRDLSVGGAVGSARVVSVTPMSCTCP